MKTDPPQSSKPSTPSPRPKGKVFDVMRPGKAAASPTSRPVIVGHKSEAQSAQIAVSGIGERDNLLDPRKKIDLAPSDGGAAESHRADPQQPELRQSAAAKPAGIATVAALTPANKPGTQSPPAIESLPETSIDQAVVAVDSETQAASGGMTPAEGAAEPVSSFASSEPAEPDHQLTDMSVAAAGLAGSGLAAQSPALASPTQSSPVPASSGLQSAQPSAAQPAQPPLPNALPASGSGRPTSPQPVSHVKPLTAEELAAATAEVADMRLPGEAPIIETHPSSGSHLLRNIVLAAILLLLTICVADLLLDAQVITLNIPHTHFFGM
ncbi:MAG TPA: hypothetical protein VJP80_06075 [Candidatus Saccharimonadales bacterium]|nr:hypothetical protein [Candidatus Saccharimonadales bacterium]